MFFLDRPNDIENLLKDIHIANVGDLSVNSVQRIFKYCIHSVRHLVL